MNTDHESHEFAQQELIQGIIDDLHMATRDDDTYVDSFAELAVDLINVAFSKTDASHPVHELFRMHVLPKIEAFTPGLVERKYLEGRLLERLVSGSLVTQTTSAYTREQLEKRT